MKCPRCLEQFSTEREYRAHAVATHGAPESILNGDSNIILPPTAQQIEAPTATQVKGFDEDPNPYIPTTTRPKSPLPQEQPKNPPSSVPQIPKLTYQYQGTCDKGHTVSTLEIDIGKKHVCVAFCASCNKQVMSQEVPSL